MNGDANLSLEDGGSALRISQAQLGIRNAGSGTRLVHQSGPPDLDELFHIREMSTLIDERLLCHDDGCACAKPGIEDNARVGRRARTGDEGVQLRSFFALRCRPVAVLNAQKVITHRYEDVS